MHFPIHELSNHKLSNAAAGYARLTDLLEINNQSFTRQGPQKLKCYIHLLTRMSILY